MTFPTRPLAALLAAAAALLHAAAAPAAALDAALAKAMAGTPVPAMAAVTLQGGKVVAEGVQGVRRNDGRDPAQLGDPWLIGSDAKPMTATLVAKLVDRGLLSWSTPLAKLLPGLAATMRPEYRDVTLPQLLSHHAGLPENLGDEAYFATFHTDARPLPEQRLAYLARALTEPPVAPPGTKFSYSNTGLLLAAAVAEHASNASYETLMRDEVFAPLGMTGVQFGTTHEGQPQGHVNGHPATLQDANPLMFAPAGNLSLPMGDWARFCLDQMAGVHGNGRLLKPETYRFMQARQPGGGTAGLGWGVQDSVAGHPGPVLTHSGSDGNWFALVALFPQTGSGVLVAANAGDDMQADAATKAAFLALLP